ncbi:hypothetical protein [Algisphaera agarilytica]|uniref:NPCBM-associated, NEW3 domain of alpha-galactosidase n=1 Tax=Algisphaera agarilytica TaxID=1385975 RepID=A0A7X0LN55_9BACT|nr:hypothetical protein [Algisphaera agarilytica]MBB6431673.1 hypothetical protein [Algisphaera agarilytica]
MRDTLRISAWLSVCLLLLSGTSLHAQIDPLTPKRLVEKYDFEDMNDQGVKLGRGLALPPGWYAMGRSSQSSDPNFDRLPMHDRLSRRAGFPMHNVVRYSEVGDAASEDYSLHLGIDGGSAGAYLQIGALPAVPGSDYLISGKIRTAGLTHAAARMRAYFVDTAGKRIETSTRLTPRVRTAGEWSEVELILPGEFGEAAYVGLEVELVQPSADPRNPLGNHQIVLHDVTGHAWFDDIGVWQLPHVQLSTGSPVNVTRSNAGPFWDVSVRDLVGGKLTARVTVYDHNMNVVIQDRRPMGWGAPSKWRWSPDLPRYGWYLAELAVVEGSRTLRQRTNSPDGRTLTIGGMTEELSIDDTDEADPAAIAQAQVDADAGRVIARTYNAVLWLPPGTGAVGEDAERFALVAEGMSNAQLKLLPELANLAGLGSVILSAWSPETTLAGFDLRLNTLREAIGPIKNAGRRVELSFSPVPEELAHTRGVNTYLPAAVFGAPSDIWMPYVQPILVRHGQRVNTWQLGSAREPSAAYLPELGSTVARTYEAFRHWTPAPTMGVPWRIDQPFRPDIPEEHLSYAVQWPVGVTPDRLNDHIQQQQELGWASPSHNRRLHIKPAPADAVPHAARASDLALRMVHAWEQNEIGVAIPDLWARGLERRESLLPDPLLGVASNVANRLAGYRAIGRLNLGEERVGIIFERRALSEQEARAMPDARPGEGMLVAWNVKAPGSRSKLDMFLGDYPKVYDVWGNATPLALNENGEHTLELSDTPVFVTGIDAKLALFRSSFVLNDPFITSTQIPHVRTVRLTNPWPVTVSGKFIITGPESWTIKPHHHRFSIGPGRSIELPVALRFPINEVAGGKSLTVDMEFTADRKYIVKFATPMELGLQGVRFEASLALEDGAAPSTVDASVTCIITNTGDEPISLSVFAKLKGHARKERLIPRLDPGQAVIRQLRFVDAAPALSQSDIRLGVRETNGPAVLNQTVGVNDVE